MFFRSPRFLLVFCLCGVMLPGLFSCTYKDRVAPVQLPDGGASTVTVGDGLKIAARAFVDPAEAESALGFDVRKAGLLPVQITFKNDGSKEAQIIAEQTLLLDRGNNAWPVVSLEKVYQRTKGYVEIGETAKSTGKPALLMGAAGAIAGLAVGIVSGQNVGEAMGKGAVIGAAAGAVGGGAVGYQESADRIREDLREKTLQNSAILPNEIAYGILFFPGSTDEAKSAEELRLALAIGGESLIVRVPLIEKR